MTNLRKENRELLELLVGIRADMLIRGEQDNHGGKVVNMSNGLWHRLNEMIDRKPIVDGLPKEPTKLPEHHKQWFDQLKRAAIHGDLALMSCLDAKTMEPRSVLTLVGHEEGQFTMTPVGHLSTSDNPYEAYLPPRIGEEQETHR
jgi:hypothetical protein